MIDYSINTLLKKGGKVIGAIGFPWDPKVYIDPCKFCANFGNHSDGSKGCLETVFLNGILTKDYSLSEIRKRINESI